MRKCIFGLALCLLLVTAPILQAAPIIGYYVADDVGQQSANSNVQAAIAATGSTGIGIYNSNLATFDFSTIDVLYTARYGTNLFSRAADLEAWVRAGGVLLIDDALSLPGYFFGVTPPTVAGAAGTDIDIVTSSLITNGPHGTISDTTLDGGTYSYHNLFTGLPSGSTPIFDSDDGVGALAFYYPLDQGLVYYSSIPMEYYLFNNGPEGVRANFNTIYLPNLLEFGIAAANVEEVPEPASLAVWGLVAATGGLLGYRRRQQQRTNSEA